ncbi:hypothetical protein LOTGIDRAFT_157509 [Lottia gigantea]|uniref:Uncharacterized protein n=1 Tax=Lottia gigantea TaxID=225164 RepID=V4CGW3_LOTGI|nr:hypothetical protein LOTGIDRAFT_157509 [Lottia gigantea]ESP01330.1 hypothetical protein LOTGIDRAFT_157509 [Lottia gigantea]
MANKFGLGSLSLETKIPNTTAWINKAKPYFVDQIGDTLRGDLDMNNFKVTDIKSPENDNDAVREKYLREQINSIEVKVDTIFFKQNLYQFEKVNARKVLQFINGTKNVETKELEINDENSKPYHLYEIKTSGKYIDRFRMLIIPDKEEDEFSFSVFDMIKETESPPSISIIRNPEPKQVAISYQFLRATDFEYVKLYFVNKSFFHKDTFIYPTDLFTSIDIHKSQLGKQFIIFSSIIEQNDVTEVGGIYTCRCKISINIKKTKFSVHLDEINDSKEQIFLVSVIVFFIKPEIIITDNEKIKNERLYGQPVVDVKHFPYFALSEIHLIQLPKKMELESGQQYMIEKQKGTKRKAKFNSTIQPM